MPEDFGSGPLVVTATLTLAPEEQNFFDPEGENYGDTDVVYDSDNGNIVFTIPGGVLSYTLNLTTVDNDEFEALSQITLSLIESDSYDVGDPGSAVTRVRDNDVIISMGIEEDVTEGSDVTAVVTLSHPATEEVSVTIATLDDSATSLEGVTQVSSFHGVSLGKDYESKSETITFAAGEQTKRFIVTTLDDTLSEVTEDFYVYLVHPSENARVVTALGSSYDRANILDNDEQMQVGIYREGLTVNEDADGPVVYRLQLSPQEGSNTTAAESRTTVDLTAYSGTARRGKDFRPRFVAGSWTTIPRGELSKTVEVNLIDDELFELLDENFSIQIKRVHNLVMDSDNRSIETAIRDDDHLIADVEAVWPNVLEGEEALFRVSLTPTVSTRRVVVDYTVVGSVGTADYTAPSGTLTIPAGDSFGEVSIATLMDEVVDPDETLGLQLTRVVSNEREIAVVAREDPSVTTILDPGALTASISAGESVDEGGSLGFTVLLSATAENPVHVKWATSDESVAASATAGEDYTSAEGTLIIPAGGTSVIFNVETLDDNLYEGDETLIARLTSAQLVLGFESTEDVLITAVDSVGTISDTDAKPSGISLAISPSQVSEDAGSTELTVTATLDGQSRLPDDLVVSVTLGDLTDDLTISAGQASGSLTLDFTPVDDEEHTGDRTEQLTGAATDYEVTPATLTIIEDEVLATGVALMVSPTTVREGAGATDLEVTGTLTGGIARPEDTEVTLSVQGVAIPAER